MTIKNVYEKTLINIDIEPNFLIYGINNIKM